jgi:Calcineurin-like phosphoesterase
MNATTQRIFFIGDIHGEFDALVTLLRRAGLVDEEALTWSGGTTMLWFMGDFFDRGPDGIAVVELIMRLQQEALIVGGSVQSLLGNHEVLIMSAQRFANQPARGPGGTFYSAWKGNGGQDSNLRRLMPKHIEWMTNLPAMAYVEDRLLIHADSTFYMDYGNSMSEVNQAIAAMLHSYDDGEWDLLLDEFTRREFDQSRPGGEQRARQMLQNFGGQQIIHGHTPINYMTKQNLKEIHEPLIYADGLCINIDGGLSYGGNGVIYELPWKRAINEIS